MKRISFILLFVFARFISYSQDPNVKEMRGQAERKSEVKDTTGWQKGGVIGISLAQGSSKNWAAGAEKFSFSTASTVSVFANIREGKMYWNNTLDLGYAIQNTHNLDSSKSFLLYFHCFIGLCTRSSSLSCCSSCETWR